MDRAFIQILNMSLTAGYVILVVLLARLMLKKSPKVISYALWSIVLFRLVCPFSFESRFSFVPTQIPTTPEFENYSLLDKDISFGSAASAALSAVGDAANGGLGVLHVYLEPATSEERSYTFASHSDIWILFGKYIWVAGIAALLIYSIISLLRLRSKLVGAVKWHGNIYFADRIPSPFVLGIVRPKIYLPSALSEDEQEYILLHEQTHIRRLDYIFKIAAFFALVVHWFNPLVWVAYVLFIRDMEMSCDESVMKNMDTDIRQKYSASLLSLATGRRIIAGTPLAFGEGDTKSRIKNVMSYKKPAFWVIAASIILAALISVGLLTNSNSTTVKNKVLDYLHEYGYSESDISEIQVKRSYMNLLWSYNEWDIQVEYHDQPGVIYHYAVKNGGVVHSGVSGAELDKSELKHFDGGGLTEFEAVYSDETEYSHTVQFRNDGILYSSYVVNGELQAAIGGTRGLNEIGYAVGDRGSYRIFEREGYSIDKFIVVADDGLMNPAIIYAAIADDSPNTDVDSQEVTGTAAGSTIPLSELPKKYPSEVAISNGDYVELHGTISNRSVMSDFISKVQKQTPAFVRVVMYTIEGDPIITDFSYNAEYFSVTIDWTRDGYGPQNIDTHQYNNLVSYENKDTGRTVLIVTDLPEITKDDFENGFDGVILRTSISRDLLLYPGVPANVLVYANEYIADEIAYYENEVGYKIIDSEITRMSIINTGTAGLTNSIGMWRLEYRLLPENPGEVVVNGGMRMDGDWITEWGSSGQPLLVIANYAEDGSWERVGITNTLTVAKEFDGDYTAAAIFMAAFAAAKSPTQMVRLELNAAGYDDIYVFVLSQNTSASGVDSTTIYASYIDGDAIYNMQYDFTRTAEDSKWRHGEPTFWNGMAIDVAAYVARQHFSEEYGISYDNVWVDWAQVEDIEKYASSGTRHKQFAAFYISEAGDIPVIIVLGSPDGQSHWEVLDYAE